MEIYSRIRCIVGVLLTAALALFMMPASASAAEESFFSTLEFEAYAATAYFTWEEYDNGERLLEETGPLFGAGGKLRVPVRGRLAADFRGEVFGGRVDYDGQTWDGDPVTTDTDYVGVKLEADLGWDLIASEKTVFAPFAGLGARIWERELRNTLYWDESEQETQVAVGYNEYWQNYYARLGFDASHAFSDRVSAFAAAALKLPIDTENEVDLTDSLTLELEPGNRYAAYAELGASIGRLRVSLFYEGLRFSESDPEYGYNDLWFIQPESEADIFGINAGWRF